MKPVHGITPLPLFCRRILRLLPPLLLALLLSGCSVKGLVTRQVTPVIDGMVESLFAEPDLQLARTAFEADIKLIEGLRRSLDSRELQVRQAMALAGYALLFCEGVDNERASRFYRRSLNVGLELLGEDPFERNQEDFEAWLVGMEDQEALFWTAFPYGAWMALNLSENEATFRLHRVEAMIARASELNPHYFFGAGDLFAGAIHCVKPRFIGGDPAAGQALFHAVGETASRGLLLPLYFEARYYCPASLDEERFDQILQSAEQYDLSQRPDMALLNHWALEQIRALGEMRGELF